MKKVSFLFFVLLFSYLGGFAQGGNAKPALSPANEGFPATAQIFASKTADVAVGDEITLSVKVKPNKEWHCYSVIPPGSFAYTATTFYLDGEKGVKTVGRATESAKPHEENDELMGGIVRHFDDGQEITYSQRYKITATEVKLKGGISMQICMANGQCVPAEWLISWDFKAKEATGLTPTADTLPDTTATNPLDTLPKDTATIKSDSAAGPIVKPAPAAGCDAGALLSIFIQAFLFGFVALITPCVFPMIPLTVSFFVKQSKSRKEGIRNALLYGLSIIFIYSVVGVGLTIIFGETFLYEISSAPLPNIFFFLILFVFALSFLGWFEIKLPSSWSNKLDEKADRGGFIGIFFMALVLVVVSFSCTGPIIGTLLVGAAGGGAGTCFWTPVVGMFAFGLSFAIPFGLFAFFPGLLSSLPKSGGWMNTVKVFLGFAELALCMKFLSNADLALHWHILDRQVFIGIWIVIFALLGLYLLGKIRLPHDDEAKTISVPRLMLAIASFSFVMYLVPGLWGGKLDTLEGLIPPMHKEMGVKLLPNQVVAGGGSAQGDPNSLNGQICSTPNRLYQDILSDRETHGFCVFYDYDQALAFAKEKKRPLFVDFTGHTCANCRRMEQNVWVNDKVHKLLTEEFVMVSLYVDEPKALESPITLPNGKVLKTVGSQFLNLETTRYGTVAQPYYALQDFDGSDLEAPVGAVFDANTYAAFLESGVNAFYVKHPELKK